MDKVTARVRSPASWSCRPRPSSRWRRMLATLRRRTYALYGFAPLDTPAIESRRGAPRQGRRRDGKADLPLHAAATATSRCASTSPCPWPSTSRPITRSLALPLPPLPDRQGLARREGPARPLPRVLPGRHRRHRRRQARHHERRRGPRRHRPRLLPSSASTDFTIRINNRKVLGGYFELLGVTDRTHRGPAAPSTSWRKSALEKVHAPSSGSDCGLDGAAAGQARSSS